MIPVYRVLHRPISGTYTVQVSTEQVGIWPMQFLLFRDLCSFTSKQEAVDHITGLREEERIQNLNRPVEVYRG